MRLPLIWSEAFSLDNWRGDMNDVFDTFDSLIIGVVS